MPFVFYEILELATRGNAEGIVPLIESVITVTQIDPEGLAKLPRVVDLGLPHVAESDLPRGAVERNRLLPDLEAEPAAG